MLARLASVLALVVVLGGCKAKDKQATPPPSTGSATASAQPPPPPPKPALADLEHTSIVAITDAMNAHDATKYAAVFAATGVQKEIGAPDASGRDAIAARMKAFFTSAPDLKFAFERTWSKGPTLVSTFAWTGTDTGGFNGAKPTKRPVGTTGAAVATYGDDGLITELRLYIDDGALLSQLDPKSKAGTFRAPPTLPTSTESIVSKNPADEDKLVETIKPLYAALDAKKEKDALAFFTDDTVLDDSSAPSPKTGMKEAKAQYMGYVTAFPDFTQLPMTNQWGIGNYVISEGILKGTQKAPIGPIKASGKPVAMHFLDIIAVDKNGKLARLQTFSNSVELLTQIGAIPAKK